MAVTAFVYGSFLAKALNKEVDWDTDSIKVALCTSTYVPAQDTHDYFDDITNEVTGTGYTAGGEALTTKTATYTTATNTWKYDADDVIWANSTITARYAIIYDASGGTAATNPLIAYVDFGADEISTGGNFTIVWDAAGIFTITVS